MLTGQTEYLLRLHRQYRNGHYPFSGGWLEQPAAYIQAMEYLDVEKC